MVLLALLMLAFLTLLGIAATTTTTLENRIAQNERLYTIHFNAAEAAALHAVQWLENASPADAGNHENFVFFNNGRAVTPDWNSPEDALAFFRNPGNWLWSGIDSNSLPLPVEDGGGNLQYPNTYFAIVDAGTATAETMDETADAVVRVFHCFGLYQGGSTRMADRGVVLIEMGYKRRI